MGAREEGGKVEQLGSDAGEGKHIDWGVVGGRPQEQLGGPVPPGRYVVGEGRA